MIKNPSDAAVRRIMKENDVVQSAIQLANSGYTKTTGGGVPINAWPGRLTDVYVPSLPVG